MRWPVWSLPASRSSAAVTAGVSLPGAQAAFLAPEEERKPGPTPTVGLAVIQALRTRAAIRATAQLPRSAARQAPVVPHQLAAAPASVGEAACRGEAGLEPHRRVVPSFRPREALERGPGAWPPLGPEG